MKSARHHAGRGFIVLLAAIAAVTSCSPWSARPAKPAPTSTALKVSPAHLVESAPSDESALVEVPDVDQRVLAETEPPPSASPSPPHPLSRFSDAELQSLVRSDLESLGSISVGLPNSGILLNGVQMPDDPRWKVVDPSHAYGTQETVEWLQTVIAFVAERHPHSPPLHVGHISGPKGGHLRPHRSHQSGRDVDVGFYYSDESTWYQRASESNLDLQRTWALIRAFITHTDVHFILLSHRLQGILRKYAETIGEDGAWLQAVFEGGPGRNALIRHEPGHDTHLHVRFYAPISAETARRCYGALVANNLVKPPVHYISHRARKGDTLIGLAKRYGTTVRTIQRANGMRGKVIFAKKTYRIPRQGPANAMRESDVPPRLLPPYGPDPGLRAARKLQSENEEAKR